MTRRIGAIYENGVLRPLEKLSGLAERAHVIVTVDVPDGNGHPLAECVGTLPDEDAAEMSALIADEFERINPHEWQ